MDCSRVLQGVHAVELHRHPQAAAAAETMEDSTTCYSDLKNGIVAAGSAGYAGNIYSGQGIAGRGALPRMQILQYKNTVVRAQSPPRVRINASFPRILRSRPAPASCGTSDSQDHF